MSDKKPLSAAENKARMDKGLAAGKTFYLRSGKKLRGKQTDGGGVSASPAAPAASKPNEGKDIAKPNEGKVKQ